MGEQSNRTIRSLQEVLMGLCKDVIVRRNLLGTTLESELNKLSIRASNEGEQFALQVLPSLGRYLDHGLVTGLLPESPPHGCLGRRVSSKVYPSGYFSAPTLIPTFFREIFPFGKIVDLDDPIKHSQTIALIADIRQLLAFFKKVEVDIVSEDAKESWAKRVSAFPSTLVADGPYVSEIRDRARRLIKDVFSESFDLNRVPDLCRNGPGAVADRVNPSLRWSMNPVVSVTHPILLEALRANPNHAIAEPVTPTGSHGETKVLVVPKDFRGPRIISCEPAVLQFLQQGIARLIMERTDNVCLCKQYRFDRINFANQGANRALARRASQGSEHDVAIDLATIDMKDASDNITLELVSDLFSEVPDLLDMMLQVRSRTAMYTICGKPHAVELQCFAPMGSALCFPIESLVHWALARATADLLWERRALRPMLSTPIFVYGDDIILHRALVIDVSNTYRSCGMSLNVSKSCYRTTFRESCGGDYLSGVWITPIKISRLGFTSIEASAETLASIVAAHNGLGFGWPNTQSALQTFAKVLHLPFCQGGPDVPGLSFRTDLDSGYKTRFSKTLQRIEYLVPVCIQTMIPVSHDGWGQLHAALLGRRHQRVPAPCTLKVRRRWTGRNSDNSFPSCSPPVL